MLATLIEYFAHRGVVVSETVSNNIVIYSSLIKISCRKGPFIEPNLKASKVLLDLFTFDAQLLSIGLLADKLLHNCGGHLKIQDGFQYLNLCIHIYTVEITPTIIGIGCGKTAELWPHFHSSMVVTT